ncbi:MAG: hypothetical protein DRP88_03725 [Candidatus Neomarinimicrobiota bacterium]|nr:MAG: hypothetical protein DRP88_03725 [Candidatus Neomarinimicrobiota bacterium]
MRARGLLFTVYFIFSVCLLANPTIITIDLSERYQVIDNFGASDCWSMQKIGAWHENNKIKVADLLFSVEKGIGLSAWRFNIGAGINRTTIFDDWRTVETFEIGERLYDWTRQEEERWFLQAAKERGVEQFIAFVNSPPARMTRNGYTNCTDGLGSTNLKEGYEPQFAKYLADILKHFRDEWGIEFDYISPVNEPQWEWNYGCNQEGNRASNEDIRAIISALHAELKRQGLDTKISVVESGDLESWYKLKRDISAKYGENYGNYLYEVIGVDSIRNKIADHFCGHSYWSDLLNGELVEDRVALSARIKPFLESGMKYWVTEYCVMEGPYGEGGYGRDLGINTALNVARVIHFDLTILNASAWQWWTAVSPENYKDGLIYTDYKYNPKMENIIESKTLWALGNYSRFIRPGSVRIGLTGANDKYSLMGSAYVNSDETKMILVFVNVSNSPKPVRFEIKGLDEDRVIRSFIPYITSDNERDNLCQYPSVHVDSVYVVPARSIVTLVGDIENTAEIDVPEALKDFRLFQNYPNPFNSMTRIPYYIKHFSKVKIDIFSINGTNVKSLINRYQSPGYHDDIIWDGTDMHNQKVSSGVYFCTMEVKGKKDIKKVVFIR